MTTNPYSSPTPLSDPDSYGIPGKKQTPVAGIVLGILHILYGLSCLVCNGATGVFFVISLPAEMTEGNAAFEVMRDNSFFKFYNYAAVVAAMLSGFLFIAAGVGLLTLRPYGRRLSIGLALFEFALLIISLVVNGIFLFPVMMRQIDAEAAGSPEQLGAITGLVSGLVGVALSAVYPAIVLFMMYRHSLVAAYQESDTA